MRRFNDIKIAGLIPAILLFLSHVPVMADIGKPANELLNIKKTVVRTTSWGQSDDVRNDLGYNNPASLAVGVPSRKLTNVLNSIFPSGVYKIFAFDEKTPGFSSGNLTLLVAVGGDTVAIINSGDGTADCVTPTDIFTTTGTPNVFVFKNADISAVAPLTYAEVTRNVTDNNRGYLYVGGCNGMARLQLANGNGWDNAGNGLRPADLDANFTTNYSFKRIPAFDALNVVAIQSRGTDLVVLTTEELLHASSIATSANTTITRRLPARYGTDLILTEDWAIFATTAGVFWTNPTLTTAAKAVPGLTDTPVSLDYLSLIKGYHSRVGNLFIMTENRDNDRGKVYRYFVDDMGIKPIHGAPVIDWQQFRRDVTTDGLVFFSSRIASSDQNDLLQLDTRDGGINSLTNAINVPAGTRYAGRPVRDPASGGWVVPGQSVRVNE